MSQHFSQDRRPGMTLVEVLVVIAIIGLLFGLSIPAVQRMREAANQTSCRNNLRQIGLALNGYHGARGCLPPGYLFDESHTPGPDVLFNTFPGWGWAAHLLPHLEQEAIAQRIRWNAAIEDPIHDGIRTQIIKTFVCPSDINTGVFNILSQTNEPMIDAATNSYAACYGFGGRIGEYPTRGNGVFFRNSKTRFIDIRDGTSTTLVVGERGAMLAQAPWMGAFSSGTIRTDLNGTTFMAAIEEAPVMVMARTVPYTLSLEYAELYNFFSPHPGIGIFLFADGSVRSLRYGLSEQIWEAIGTIAGGETVSTGDF